MVKTLGDFVLPGTMRADVARLAALPAVEFREGYLADAANYIKYHGCSLECC